MNYDGELQCTDAGGYIRKTPISAAGDAFVLHFNFWTYL